MTKQRKATTETAAIVAEICLFGTRLTGAGWIARTADGRILGTGNTRPETSFTEAVWAAAGGLSAAFELRAGLVRVFDAGGSRMATIELSERVPLFGDLRWSPAPSRTFTVAELEAAATEIVTFRIGK